MQPIKVQRGGVTLEGREGGWGRGLTSLKEFSGGVSQIRWARQGALHRKKLPDLKSTEVGISG